MPLHARCAAPRAGHRAALIVFAVVVLASCLSASVATAQSPSNPSPGWYVGGALLTQSYDPADVPRPSYGFSSTLSGRVSAVTLSFGHFLGPRISIGGEVTLPSSLSGPSHEFYYHHSDSWTIDGTYQHRDVLLSLVGRVHAPISGSRFLLEPMGGMTVVRSSESIVDRTRTSYYLSPEPMGTSSVRDVQTRTFRFGVVGGFDARLKAFGGWSLAGMVRAHWIDREDYPAIGSSVPYNPTFDDGVPIPAGVRGGVLLQLGAGIQWTRVR